MRLAALPGTCHLTYCTNIHAGETWPDIRASLESFLPAIKRQVSPEAPMGVGLRLSGIAADALAEPEALDELRAFLAREGLYVFTINAFPYGPFHGTRVKEEVYQPDWTTPERLRFTNLAADILASLLPEGVEGSVSTVPGTFKPLAAAPGVVERMAAAMVRHAAHLVGIERRTGRRVTLAVEPEPCCFLETIEETVAFWRDHLLAAPARQLLCGLTGLDEREADAALRRHLGVCYDVCHAAVEFEEPADALAALASAGIGLFKIQVSAGLSVPRPDADALAALAPFAEGVYLHQVVARTGKALRRHVDLPAALAQAGAGGGDEWRVHFHVPIYLERFGHLEASRQAILDCVRAVNAFGDTGHFEVETYAWGVLPPELQQPDLAAGIAQEMSWFRTVCQQPGV
jgi:sugar phosphate isomerase/epimerase